MIIGHHLIWTAYGWWLPNDPRGSMSLDIRVEKIANLGDSHYGRKRVQPPSAEIRQFYEVAADALQHPLLTLTPDDFLVVAKSLRQVMSNRRYTCYACAIMPDHVHLLIRRHRDQAEEMIEFFQQDSRKALIDSRRRPATHPVWGGRGWKVFQNSPEQMVYTIDYIWTNPLKAGLPAQKWDFVVPYAGWRPRNRK